MELIRTSSASSHFQDLVRLLDAELAIRDGADHAFYHQFNGTTTLQEVIVGMQDGKPVACGAFKPFNDVSVEIKRMFTIPEYRGNGAAMQVLHALELWASELDYKFCVLETGLAQPEAIALYEKMGYERIQNYGQYIGIEKSVCYRKSL